MLWTATQSGVKSKSRGGLPHARDRAPESTRRGPRSMDPGALMELRQIDCFLAVATELHFGKAAERLFLAQSSVAEALRSLEQEIGGRLFLRTSRRVEIGRAHV